MTEPMTRRGRSPGREHPPSERSDAISRSSSRHEWVWLRNGVGALVLGVLVWRLGAGPFVEGVRTTSPATLLTATGITALTTVSCAVRWRLVAARLAAPVELAAAIAAVYRAQLLNVTLPGGILGDVHRAAGHARTATSAAAGVRSVVWERVLGQVVQVLLTVTLVLVLPSPLRHVGLVSVASLLGVVATAVALWAGARRSTGLAGRLAGAAARDVAALRGGGLAIAATSALALAGHLVVFVLAARIAGVHAPVHELLPIAAVVLLAAGLPINVAGWGPREGVAAWAFATTGLGAAAGVTTAVAYGVMATVATLPGVVVLLGGYRARDRARSATPARDTLLLQEAVRG